jgi:hypothetical protein
MFTIGAAQVHATKQEFRDIKSTNRKQINQSSSKRVNIGSLRGLPGHCWQDMLSIPQEKCTTIKFSRTQCLTNRQIFSNLGCSVRNSSSLAFFCAKRIQICASASLRSRQYCLYQCVLLQLIEASNVFLLCNLLQLYDLHTQFIYRLSPSNI